jgi:hypothetical protein
MAGGVAIFLLLVTVLLKLLPVVALWEMHEEAFASGPATSPGGYADPSETFAGVADPGIVAGARS